jgi:hypothetical protein
MGVISTLVDFALNMAGKTAGATGTAAGKGIGATLDTIAPSVSGVCAAAEEARKTPIQMY